ncbi:methenyltetrahydrofolate cyclohydrolase [Thermogymnomonas acidicola]|uniref:Methenyltetrahydrofolate cyclohydrolase n=1 Tax=Thermogymnomonas acidicola TaxID=399579 RepID=A0AA37BPY9_9ARCH|nr:cyclodeaminase/cyclohydrolase family protein [Thermogymnomonas acidicola]GGM67932.1 methenyltetrahydrofolate cyclohydrolase [Thermogymnomonas acidicola]
MESLDSFMERLASPSPAPGGGAASALVALTAASLITMVSKITMEKKGYEDRREEMARISSRSLAASESLRHLIEEDERAFNRVVQAWKMPKATEEEKARRAQALREASRYAISVPWKIALVSSDIMDMAAQVARDGLKSAVTDAGSAAEFALSAARAVLLNVRVNAQNLSDGEREDEEIKTRLFLEDMESRHRKVMETVGGRM